ncbi:MAG: NAD-dependent epimerase/dehydratase family protein [Chloroflexi bacterium]|nr:MAG: NAD-dependent epimerase/dehydratase family protein [Chloroflexota bacterium]
MKIAITGGTGFVGRHLAIALLNDGHEVVVVARGVDRRDPSILGSGVHFVAASTDDDEVLRRAFAGCDAVAHFAGINREIGAQTYERVHVRGTRAVVDAARASGVGKIIYLSFLRARPACGSPYHESKWAAEELVRGSGIDHTILKSGVIYGRGDHLLDHVSRALYTFPVFALVGLRPTRLRPVYVADVVRLARSAMADSRLARRTVAVLGPEELAAGDAIRRIAAAVGREVPVVPAPVWAHRILAWIFERTMAVPLVAAAQVRILSESVVVPLPFADPPPSDLAPATMFSVERIRAELPPAGPFGLRDLRLFTH